MRSQRVLGIGAGALQPNQKTRLAREYRIATETHTVCTLKQRWPEEMATDTASFEDFVRSNAGPLIRTLTLVALDREAAADASQEAFCQLYLNWQKISAYEDPVAWLYRVGINRCRDHQRRRARAARLFNRLTVAAETRPIIEDWTPDIELMSVLSQLPVRQRATAVLFYQADFSIAHIAALMHISEGAVNSHLHKARKALRKVLEAE
jgi:RNA polymerase sigma-70 factor, ECF subfamily